ncbi:MAG TPA: cytochrome c biogenesis protein CcsA [Burkholderiales bacterium]|nr:cytochrome c biogenesis protein CcsA [Burkholderiales bacterium]
MQSILPHLICAILYAALAFYFWRRHWSGEGATDTDAPSRRRIEHAALLAPFALHTWLLSGSMFGDTGLYLGVGNALSLILWLTVLIYGLGSLYYRLDGLHALVLPAAAIAVLLPAVFPSIHALANTETWAFKAHLLISMLAYSLFTIASLHVMLMAIIERRLHTGALPTALQNMPPLLAMEALLFRIIAAGFVLLTLTIGSGVLFSEELFGKPARLSHKTVFGVLSWLIFGALLGGRLIYGWRGRTAVRWTLAGFLTLVLAYIGSKFVLEVILGR